MIAGSSEIKKWVDEQSEYLFEYAMKYVDNFGVATNLAPKFHMVDTHGRIAVMSCDFWEEDEEKNINELGMVLDKLYSSFEAVASLLVIFGTINDEETVCILVRGDGIDPVMHCKPVIWRNGVNHKFADFGPTTIKPHDEIKNLKF
jgi:hypothetical protein